MSPETSGGWVWCSLHSPEALAERRKKTDENRRKKDPVLVLYDEVTKLKEENKKLKALLAEKGVTSW